MVLRHAEHAASAAGGIIDGLHHMAASQVLLRGEQEIDHELDDLARSEVLPGLFIRLLSPDADQFLKHVAHLHIVHGSRGEVDGGKLLHHKVQQILPFHEGDLLAKLELFHDGPDIGREAIDVAVEVRRELIGIIQQAVEPLAGGLAVEGELGEVVERHLGDLRQSVADDVFPFGLEGGVFLQHGGFGGREDAVEPAQHGEREDDLAVLIPFVRPP